MKMKIALVNIVIYTILLFMNVPLYFTTHLLYYSLINALCILVICYGMYHLLNNKMNGDK